ncbi:MAG: isoleucine--tRNA ligase [Flavobacteriales bacterium CG_4_9_14_3_um_filter_40_17]|nr:MAG: isoleucine--tRNA ligase [Flavobacteriales bacterium CG_4_9_14_3_um_filter_40_17]
MNKKFKEYNGLNLPQVADEISDYWKSEAIFEKSISSREGSKPFIFFEGPPSANGLPGIHHVMARTLKDIFCRYKTQKGFQVNRKAGWDTHGLPIELGVEKELGITKEDIGAKITVEEYNAACKKAVMRYTDVWNDLTEKIGYWVDMTDPYVTYEPKYMESVWWLLAQLYNKNLVYKGYTIQPYSPKAGTGLSSHELNQPGCYRDVTDTSVVAQFKSPLNPEEGTQNSVARAFNYKPLAGEKDAFMLAWTTTPWTLPSNTALTVGEKIDYVLIKTFNQYTFEPTLVVLAKALVGKQFAGKFFLSTGENDFTNYTSNQKNIPYKILSECKGKNLIGIRYEQLLPYALPYQHPENAFRVISGDFVTTEDGTGIVHTAPTFGADDAKVAKEAVPEVPPLLVLDEDGNPVPLVDLQGKFTRHLGEFAGKYVKNEYYEEGEAPEKSVDIEIAIKLKEENKAFKVEKYVHSYPHCWRTDKPVLYYPLDSWFIKVTEMKDRMYELNQTINWKPKSTGEGRFGNWLKNANDWNLSRSRFWGIPLPIWRTEDGREEICIGSVKQLKEEIQKSIDEGLMLLDPFADFVTGDMREDNYVKIDLHKNIVDQIILVSPLGKPMHRESDLIDVWFDSGSMPYAQWHYPFENKDKIDTGSTFPADYICEGVDQTRGWFYTLHAIATMVFDSVAYKNVVSNGLVLDKNGQKMSKRLGNAVNPFEALKAHGPDAIRWYMMVNANPWDNLKFDMAGVEEVKRKFFGTLYNTYSFFSLYANLDCFDTKETQISLEERPEIDRWILSELHSLIKEVEEAYEDYEPTKVARAISYFVQENLSNWYVRLCRRRFWKGEYEADKIAAYQTLYTCLLEVSKLMAPLAPFFSEQLYRDLTGNESVHLDVFPKYQPHFVDKSLEARMQKAQVISSLVLSLRKKEKIKVRQPLQTVMIPVFNDKDREEIKAVSHLIQSEVNVKNIVLLEDESEILIKQIKPNFKTLGPRFGKDIGLISKVIKNLSKQEIATLERDGTLTLNIQEKVVNLSLDDVEILASEVAGWLVATDKGITVALDKNISPELKNEGIARELVNRIQNYRKDSGFEVTDKIRIQILRHPQVQMAVSRNETYIMDETLANELKLVDKLKNGIDIQFDGIETKLFIEKI